MSIIVIWLLFEFFYKSIGLADHVSFFSNIKVLVWINHRLDIFSMILNLEKMSFLFIYAHRLFSPSFFIMSKLQSVLIFFADLQERVCLVWILWFAKSIWFQCYQFCKQTTFKYGVNLFFLCLYGVNSCPCPRKNILERHVGSVWSVSYNFKGPLFLVGVFFIRLWFCFFEGLVQAICWRHVSSHGIFNTTGAK